MTGISEIKPKPNQDAVKVLESALEKAKTGEYVAVGVCWLTNDNSVDAEFSSGPNTLLMWASVEHAARSYYSDILCGDRE